MQGAGWNNSQYVLAQNGILKKGSDKDVSSIRSRSKPGGKLPETEDRSQGP